MRFLFIKKGKNMSRQIQIRRGSKEEHQNFTGAIGEITMDTTNNTLRVHDGTTVGGTVLAKQSDLDNADYVVAYQKPTPENNYTWYRKYKSGWVEQGGRLKIIIPSGTNTVIEQISLPVEMDNAFYSTNITQEQIKNSVPMAAAKRYYDATSKPSTSQTLSIIALHILSINLEEEVNYMWEVRGQSKSI